MYKYKQTINQSILRAILTFPLRFSVNQYNLVNVLHIEEFEVLTAVSKNMRAMNMQRARLNRRPEDGGSEDL